MNVIKDKLVNINREICNYQRQTEDLLEELENNVEFIECIFSRKFKVRGIHARVDDYSLRGNWIDLLPAPPSSGVDVLTLTFKEFAEQVEFVD